MFVHLAHYGESEHGADLKFRRWYIERKELALGITPQDPDIEDDGMEDGEDVDAVRDPLFHYIVGRAMRVFRAHQIGDILRHCPAPVSHASENDAPGDDDQGGNCTDGEYRTRHRSLLRPDRSRSLGTKTP